MARSDYSAVIGYAGAALVFYNVADIAVCKGFIRGDGTPKEALKAVTAVLFQRALWLTLTGRAGRTDLAYEATYWMHVIPTIILVSAVEACVKAVKRRRARVPVPPPAPQRVPARRGRGGRRA